MKVLVLGSTGIIGQHMRLSVPRKLTAWFPDRELLDLSFQGFPGSAEAVQEWHADVVVNLAGESRPDVVERNPWGTNWINAGFPEALMAASRRTGARLIQISSQAVFGGHRPPYAPYSPTSPVNVYGGQKRAAEEAVSRYSNAWIVRPTFVLGIRPNPILGRQNPAELMLSGQQPSQVSDR